MLSHAVRTSTGQSSRYVPSSTSLDRPLDGRVEPLLNHSELLDLVGHRNRIVRRGNPAPLEGRLLLLDSSGLDQQDVHAAVADRLVQDESIAFQFHLGTVPLDQELNDVAIFLDPLDHKDLQVRDL